MDNKETIELIDNPHQILDDEISRLENIILKYPYFQIGQTLLSKGLLNIKSIRYNRQLKKAAAYSSERKKLFNLISKNPYTFADKERKNTPKEKNISTTQQLSIGEPLDFSSDEKHSFSEWLNLLNIKKINRGKEKKEKDLPKDYTNLEKKITFFKAPEIAKESLIENTNIITPTLARVYLEQGHYEQAISAYRKLILKYPKKSSFFASQIELITKLMN